MSTDPFVFIFFSVVSCSCIVCNSIPFTHDNNPFAMNPFDSRGGQGISLPKNGFELFWSCRVFLFPVCCLNIVLLNHLCTYYHLRTNNAYPRPPWPSCPSSLPTGELVEESCRTDVSLRQPRKASKVSFRSSRFTSGVNHKIVKIPRQSACQFWCQGSCKTRGTRVNHFLSRLFSLVSDSTSFLPFVLGSYWVCEKSDGIRVLFLVVTDLETREQSSFIVRVVLIFVVIVRQFFGT